MLYFFLSESLSLLNAGGAYYVNRFNSGIVISYTEIIGNSAQVIAGTFMFDAL